MSAAARVGRPANGAGPFNHVGGLRLPRKDTGRIGSFASVGEEEILARSAGGREGLHHWLCCFRLRSRKEKTNWRSSAWPSFKNQRGEKGED